MLYGYDTGTIGGLQATKDWLRTFGHPDSTTASGYAITTSQASLVVSILSVGTFFGALLGAVRKLSSRSSITELIFPL